MVPSEPSTQRENPSPARRGRPPRGAALLSKTSIVEATLEVIDGGGITAVSMRAVAGALGVDAKSLYNHVDGKDGLLDAVAEHILGRLAYPEPTGDTRADLWAIACISRDQALAHPNAAPLVLTRRLSSTEALAPIEAVLSVLRKAGASPEQSVHMLRMMTSTLVGALMREANTTTDFGATGGDEHHRTTLERSTLPSIAAAASYLAHFDPADEYERTMSMAIDSIVARIGR
ncbi:MAG TPA: TetR/AcrR family transcriptional regulator C-terminal domain-containing protein [Stackebrandtia sp.]|uniref:TetR/AcrR family transcriptional regulator n=1 Tax=Stackebrandtia sp. TaxID=2023065 RepID=UPI002D65E213|nr:TetR/AcrR family transcriptional regulator C-terminal domain-containing protein [Stackebrandtia sp.]HZE37659.1 TetR/AcrR family transcriptional regulator C-terminal domain-containing protein [Stackebrandtia sp.]